MGAERERDELHHDAGVGDPRAIIPRPPVQLLTESPRRAHVHIGHDGELSHLPQAPREPGGDGLPHGREPPDFKHPPLRGGGESPGGGGAARRRGGLYVLAGDAPAGPRSLHGREVDAGVGGEPARQRRGADTGALAGVRRGP